LKTIINKTWAKILKSEFEKDYFKELKSRLDDLYLKKTCYPTKENIFSSFRNCTFNSLKVVILGQDPYHGINQANGLAFSVNKGQNLPPSLNNIFKEISIDMNTTVRNNGDLIDWSKQGVLLLNSVLTVEDGKPGSHSKIGWEKFTDEVIRTISKEKSNIVFMLWGSFAKKKEKLIFNNNHLILKSGHPSPLSANRGFWFGNKHFSRCNRFLKENNSNEIKW
jgi:uracil-DNA glycosylase